MATQILAVVFRNSHVDFAACIVELVLLDSVSKNFVAFAGVTWPKTWVSLRISWYKVLISSPVPGWSVALPIHSLPAAWAKPFR